MLLKMCVLDKRINELLCQVQDEGAMTLLSHLAGLIKTIETSHGKPGRCNSSRTIFFLFLVVLMCWLFCNSVRQSKALAPDEVLCFISHGRKPAQALHVGRVSIFEKTISQRAGIQRQGPGRAGMPSLNRLMPRRVVYLVENMDLWHGNPGRNFGSFQEPAGLPC